jgi:hypothetical protein
MTEQKDNVTAEILYYLSGAFRNAVEGGFLAREHAASIFKANLRDAGYEVTKKEVVK